MILPDSVAGSDMMSFYDQQRITFLRSNIDRRTHSDDRRWYVRYKVNSGVSIIIKRPFRHKLWTIRGNYAASVIDISLKGASVESTAFNKWPYSVSTLSIVTANKESKISSISYKLVSDCKAVSGPGPGKTRRMGIKFVNLSHHQKWQLIFLLDSATTHPILINPIEN